MFLCEGETDAMRLWQELGPERREKMGVVAIAGTDAWQDAMAESLSACKRVFVVLDNDTDYNTVGQVNKAWHRMRTALGKNVRRLYLPSDVSDLCEFFENYDVETLHEIVKKAKKPPTHYAPLDLTKPSPSYTWLMDQFICKGDTCILLGDSNVGKSFFTMTLSIAIAEGWDQFLGRKMLGVPGRVLYVDEENPEEIVKTRLKQLGLTPAGMQNIRYLWEQGIRLDRNPDKLLDEALHWEPELIVIDSLTRVHSQDENSASAMAVINNEGIKPLARETGASVIVLHHTNKGGTSSIQRTRGSVDIVNAVDAAIECSLYEAGDGECVNTYLYKTRRRQRGPGPTFRIEDKPDGGVVITHIVEPEPPF